MLSVDCSDVFIVFPYWCNKEIAEDINRTWHKSFGQKYNLLKTAGFNISENHHGEWAFTYKNPQNRTKANFRLFGQESLPWRKFRHV